ncbi:hypothetical protein M422DRAFT_48857 [Sphaerobolus stellatus SS14]|uniref:Uncharacterized protein n=1 Tax=Sphaerobolus stellatus (strain SS14) TaxID=990650 RepID=A0A0C9VSP1_SPHS4|nr:hypothetical protein M422DRAFT_48857 [Sphaerobolus stellatus SS14]
MCLLEFDAASLQDEISQNEDVLRVMEDEISVLRQKLNYLEDQRYHKQLDTDRMKGLQAPIRRIPSEILAEIFIQILRTWCYPDTERNAFPVHNVSLSTPRCSYIKYVANGTA